MNVSDVIILGEDPDLVEHVKNIKPEANYIQFNNDLFHIGANKELTIYLSDFMKQKYKTKIDFNNAHFLMASYYPNIKYKTYKIVCDHVKQITPEHNTSDAIISHIFRPFISPLSYVSNEALIDIGCFVGPFSYIGPKTTLKLGAKCNIRSSIHHASVVGKFSTISPNSTLLGNVELGDFCIVGASSTLRNDIKVTNQTYIGMSSNVTKNINSRGLFYGNPAIFVKRLRQD